MGGVTSPSEPLPGLVGFTHALRRAGLPCDQHRTAAYLSAVDLLDLADPAHLYWAGRVTLCAQPDDLPAYDEAFAAWFSPNWRPPKTTPQADQPGPVRTSVTATVLPALATSPSESGDRTPVPVLAPSDVEVLRHKNFSELSAAEREHLRELLALLRIDPPTRRASRHRPSRRGQLDPRRTVRAMLATGGEPIRLARYAKAKRPRRLVLLVDISGSMKPYADALLRFAHVITRRSPGSTEVFTLGTRMTRVSRQLRLRDPEQALASAASAVPDFAGGTRLGEGLRAFLNRWGQRGVARRAVVVLFSDGWERGDPALLAEQLARMRRLAHTVVWANPHAGQADYRPVQSGIAVALPHIDHLVAGHSLAALEAILREIRDA
ncbi:MAG TPA: VWA domain-containing protein [Pseudonocardiaceae bacterium]|nr:VWA domain-containing protein [Pseudonocardiaceae bacterium]